MKIILLEPYGVAVPQQSSIDVIGQEQLDRLALLRPIVRNLADEAGALFVPLQAIFDKPPATAWTLDGIHPTAAGHWKIARAWVSTVMNAGWFPDKSNQGDVR